MPEKSKKKSFLAQVSNLMMATDGDLTQELALGQSDLGLGQLPKRLMPDQKASLICGYCSTGCSLDVHLKKGNPVNLTPTKEYPVNTGKACPKGWEALTPLMAKDRATTPYLRNSRGHLEKVDWNTALKTFVERFKGVQEKHGKESVAFLSTGQIATEEMALLGCLSKFGMGFVHGDGNTRQCMASTAVAYKQSFGFDAPPFTYEDLEESDCLVFVGANPCIAHPIIWQRVEANKNKPRIIVVDPRKTETAMRAHRHLAINPKTDLTLFYGVANILIQNNWIDKNFIDKSVSGFEDFKKHVADFTEDKVSRVTGLSAGKLKEFAKMICGGKKVSFWWMVGVNQGHEAVRTIQALINLALITGNIGRTGTGANSITGQCNAMGSRLFSNTTGLIGGYDFTNEGHRKKIAKILNIDIKDIKDKNSMAYDQIVDGIAQGKIKGLWVIATNPAHSWVNQSDFKDYIGNLDFLVVQDMYKTTETAQMADLILPAAGWGEKEGTFINSERRIGTIQKVSKAPGATLADFYIFKLIAQYWGCSDMFKDWDSPENVFKILQEISKGQPYDISGIQGYQHIRKEGGIQWPYLQGQKDERIYRRLFEDGKFFHPGGKAKIIFEEVRPLPEPTSEQYPFVLLTGRGSSSQWHTQTRTSKSSVLNKMSSKDPYVEMNNQDAQKLHIEHGQWANLSTRRNTIKVQVHISSKVKEGDVFIPMHYSQTNTLTFPAFDKYSRQPSYKHCAAKVEKVFH